MTTRFLTGAFAPATDEVTAFDLPVTGRIPVELNGRYLRNGPNPLGLEDPEAYHLFVGEGMVHGVRLRDGRAEWYRNRWVRSREVASRLGEEWPGEEWPGGPDDEDFDFAANTHVLAHAGRTLALVEAGPRPYELSYELDTVGPFDFGGTLPGAYTAHTKHDPRTGELHAVAYHFGWEYIQYLVVDAQGAVTRTVNVPVQDGPMMHDFALTERHVILYDLPVTFSMDLAADGARLPYAWNPAHPARVGIMPRDGDGSSVRWIDIDPCFVFHTLNAYEDGDRLVVDVARYPKMLVSGRLEETPAPALDRWTIDPAAGRLSSQRIDDRPQEFPRVDERLVSEPHRYGYTVSAAELLRTKAGEALLKHDYLTGVAEVREFAAGAAVGEAVFAPRSPDAAEDDGYVMALAFDPERGATDLIILAAQDFTGEPVARIHLPTRVPAGFHGSWVPDQN